MVFVQVEVAQPLRSSVGETSPILAFICYNFAHQKTYSCTKASVLSSATVERTVASGSRKVSHGKRLNEACSSKTKTEKVGSPL